MTMISIAQLRAALREESSSMSTGPIRSSRSWQEIAREIVQTTNSPRLAELREELKRTIDEQLSGQMLIPSKVPFLTKWRGTS